MTQFELAQATGVQQVTVSTWERGERRPQFAQMRRLADVFGLSPQEITEVIEDTMTKK